MAHTTTATDKQVAYALALLSQTGYSWEEIDVRHIGDGETEAELRLADIGAHQLRVVRIESALAEARRERDRAVREAAADGVTAYRMAQVMGVAESTVGRILR